MWRIHVLYSATIRFFLFVIFPQNLAPPFRPSFDAQIPQDLVSNVPLNTPVILFIIEASCQTILDGRSISGPGDVSELTFAQIDECVTQLFWISDFGEGFFFGIQRVDRAP